MRRDEFRLTRSQARALATIIRTSSWVTELGGDQTLSVFHRDGTEVTITIASPRPVTPKVIRGFRPAGEE